MQPTAKNNAFTLIELLVSLAIFAVMATTAYSGLNQMLRVKESNTRHNLFLDKIQKTYIQLNKDFFYLSNASNRNEYGQTINSFSRDSEPSHLFLITSASRQNPMQLIQHPLIKINYYVEDEKLIRAYQNSFNQAPNTKTKKRALIDKVDLIEIRFLDNKNQWKEQWPPVSGSTGQGSNNQLPKATEIKIHFTDQGEFTWLFTQ
jgi:general secretion pathway protein J